MRIYTDILNVYLKTASICTCMPINIYTCYFSLCFTRTHTHTYIHKSIYMFVWMSIEKQILQEQNCQTEENVAFSISNPGLEKNFLNFQTASKSRWKVFWNGSLPFSNFKIPKTFSISKISLFIKYFHSTIFQYFTLLVPFFAFLNVSIKYFELSTLWNVFGHSQIHKEKYILYLQFYQFLIAHILTIFKI